MYSCLDCQHYNKNHRSQCKLHARGALTEEWILLNECVDFNKKKEEVNHPKHYNEHPSKIECIEIVRHMNFNLGNCIKYVWRAGLKSDNAIQDLKKAEFYIKDEIKRLESVKGDSSD